MELVPHNYTNPDGTIVTLYSRFCPEFDNVNNLLIGYDPINNNKQIDIYRKKEDGSIELLNKNKMDALQGVKLFHETFGHPVADKPTIIDYQRLKTRIEWIKSELDELELAVANNDIAESADALADAVYFLNGTVVEMGLTDLFPAIQAEVQRSNMSKACTTLEIAEMTVQEYSSASKECHYEVKNITDEFGDPQQIYVVLHNSDNKILKSINWSNPDLSFVKL